MLAFAQLHAQTNDTTMWEPNGIVYSVLRSGNTIYMGGDFTAFGPKSGQGVPVDLTTGKANLKIPKVVGIVNVSIADGNGGWYIGGSFSTVGAVGRGNVAHILASGMLDMNWNPLANTSVRSLALIGNVLYVGGDFVNIGGVTRFRIAAVNATTGAVLAWNPNASGSVRSIVATPTSILVGGSFTSIGGQTRNRIAALDPVTGLALSWNPSAGSAVRTIVVKGTACYVGGDFTTIGGQTRNRLAQLDLTTGAATSWNPNMNNTVYCLAVTDTTVFAVGVFTRTAVTTTRNRLACISRQTGLATTWISSANNVIYSVDISGGLLYVGGDFTGLGGAVRNRVGALDIRTGAVTSWDPNALSTVNAVNVSGNQAYVGGIFSSIGSVNRSRLAALNATTGELTSWNPSTNGSVRALALDGSTIYAGGLFSTLGGQTRSYLAGISTSTGLPTSWDPAPNQITLTLAINGGKLYVGGDFTSIAGQTRNRAASFDLGTSLVTAWDPNLNGAVRAFAFDGNYAYIGGDYTTISGLNIQYLASTNLTTGAATGWGPAPNWTVRSLAVSGSTVYAGGYFTSIGGQVRYYLGAVNSSTALATSWNPEANGPILTFGLYRSTIYVGGQVSVFSGIGRNFVAALDSATGLPNSWHPNLNGFVHALSINSSAVCIGGEFWTLGVEAQAYFASVNLSGCPPKPGISPNGAVSGCGSVTLTAPAGYSYLWSTAATTQSITVSTNGSYSVQTILTGCTSAVSEAVVVTITSPPTTPTITPSGPTTFIDGGSVTLSAPAGIAYLWSTGATSQTIIATAAGSYTVQTILGGCTSGVSAPVTVVLATPTYWVWSGTGNFKDDTKWAFNGLNTGGLPPSDPATQITVASGTLTLNDASLTLGHPYVLGKVIVKAGARLVGDNATNFPLIVADSLINLGTVNGDVTIDGSSANLTSILLGAGVYQLKTLSISGSGSSSAEIKSPITILDKLSINQESFFVNFNGQEIRLKQSVSFAGIANWSDFGANPTILGATNFVVERQYNTSQLSDPTGGWFFLASPVAGPKVSNFAQRGGVFAPNTFNTAVAGGGSFYFYSPLYNNILSNNGFYKVKSAAQPVSLGVGARVWVSKNSALSGVWEYRGAPAFGSFNFPPLPYCPTNCTFAGSNPNGWNLVGNPYPSTADWAYGPIKNNIADEIHFWTNRPSGAVYSSYANGVGVNGGTSLIPAGQAFYVVATGAGATLSFTPSMLNSTAASLKRTGTIIDPLLRINLSIGGTSRDEVALRLSPSATSAFDQNLDAHKPNGSSPNVALVANTGEPLAIDARLDGVNHTIPIQLTGLQIATQQNALVFTGINSFGAAQVYLHHPSFVRPILIQEGYQFAINDTTYLHNLSLEIVSAVTDLDDKTNIAAFSIYPNPTNSSLTFVGLAIGTEVLVQNQLGQVLLRTAIMTNNQIDVKALPAGIYRVSAAGAHQTFLKQ